MEEYDYRDKRDENGTLLRYSAHFLAADFADACYEKIKEYGVYKILSKSFFGLSILLVRI